MSEDNNDHVAQTPPPLIPPPARESKTAGQPDIDFGSEPVRGREDTPVGTGAESAGAESTGAESTGAESTGANEPVFVEPTEYDAAVERALREPDTGYLAEATPSGPAEPGSDELSAEDASDQQSEDALDQQSENESDQQTEDARSEPAAETTWYDRPVEPLRDETTAEGASYEPAAVPVVANSGADTSADTTADSSPDTSADTSADTESTSAHPERAIVEEPAEPEFVHSEPVAATPAHAEPDSPTQGDDEQADVASVDENQVDEERVDGNQVDVQQVEVQHPGTTPAAVPQPLFVPAADADRQPAPQPRAFTSPPVEPKKKGNRGIGTLIAIVSVIVFAVLYAAVAALIIAVGAPSQPLGDTLTRFLTDPVFFIPAIIFVVGFVIVVLVVNRASWWAHVLGSLFVGALVYFGTIGIQLLVNNVIAMTPSEASARFVSYAANPLVIAAALVAREVSMWMGAAVSSRGRRMKARNAAARDEFERASTEHRAEYERGYAPTA